jgi:pantoate--beta-alanine ligase
VKIYYSKDDLFPIVDNLLSQEQSIGLVPTMGALHLGHLSLVKKAMSENDNVVVSVFVNPTQFDNKNDLLKYPRTLESDVALLKTLSDSIIVYAPTVEDIYGKNIKSTKFSYDGLEFEMEGKFRKGHFDGVGTIVKRFFEIVKPTNAYFGQKDFQQLMIIKKMVEKHQLPVNIIGCPIHRENDGLAMSSRNVRLQPKFRKEAPFIYKTLQAAKQKFGTKSAIQVTKWVEQQFAENSILQLEYFIIANTETLKTVIRKSKNKKYRAFIAVYADDVRLIDNIALN